MSMFEDPAIYGEKLCDLCDAFIHRPKDEYSVYDDRCGGSWLIACEKCHNEADQQRAEQE